MQRVRVRNGNGKYSETSGHPATSVDTTRRDREWLVDLLEKAERRGDRFAQRACPRRTRDPLEICRTRSHRFTTAPEGSRRRGDANAVEINRGSSNAKLRERRPAIARQNESAAPSPNVIAIYERLPPPARARA
jgi:hypothetical protein